MLESFLSEAAAEGPLEMIKMHKFSKVFISVLSN